MADSAPPRWNCTGRGLDAEATIADGNEHKADTACLRQFPRSLPAMGIDRYLRYTPAINIAIYLP